MKYFVEISFFLAICSSLITVFYFYRKLEQDIYYKLTIKNLLKNRHKSREESFFSSLGLQQSIRYLLGRKGRKAQIALRQLSRGETSEAALYFSRRPRFLALMTAYLKPVEATKIYQTWLAKKPNDYNARAELAILYFCQGKKTAGFRELDFIPEKKAGGYARAVKSYYQAQKNLEQGGMLEASLLSNEAAKLFIKQKAFFEAAQAYLQMATVYRIAAVYDTAQFILTSALDIFRKIRDTLGEAEVLGNLGMLMVVQNRFEEAEDYYRHALELNREAGSDKAAAEILNQQGLLLVTQKSWEEAQCKTREALEEHIKLRNRQGQAFSWDILSYIYQAEKAYDKLIVSTQNALNLYAKNKNLSARLEMMYMQAGAYFALNEDKKSEKLLRQIIDLAQKNESCFHVANAYSLLGLIFLRQKDMKRAKGLFTQAVGFEERNERFSGAATDYANIALIEKKCGQTEQAEKTLQLAIDYARSFGENELEAELKDQYQKLFSKK